MSHLDDHFPEVKLFTIEQANATLPLVKAITKDITILTADIKERRSRIDHLRNGRDVNAQDLYSQELAQIEEEIVKETRQLQKYFQELRDLGVESKGAIEGLVDFPTMIDGKPACLCWKLGEPEILYWHGLDAGFSGRQRLTADMVAGDENDSIGDSINGFEV